MKDAFSLAFKNTELILSCFESIAKIKKYYPVKDVHSLLEQIRHIYVAKDINEYNCNLMNFKEINKESKFILDLLEKDFFEAKKIIICPMN